MLNTSKFQAWIQGAAISAIIGLGISVIAQQPFNLIQTNGTTVDTNSGTKSAGTIRVVLATDQPQLTNKLLVTPDANSSSNITQFGGTNISTGTGASGAGIPRVTISNDSSLAANQSVNVSQFGGNNTLTGNGTTGTGSQRVTIASDNSAIAGMGVGATGSAVPANTNYIGGNGSGNLTGYIRCDNTAVYDATTNGKTQLVGLVSGKIIYVCGVSVTQSTSTATTVSFGSGTGTNCGSTYNVKTPAWPINAPTSVGPAGLVLPTGLVPWFATNASEELCISTNAAVSVQAIVSYTQF